MSRSPLLSVLRSKRGILGLAAIYISATGIGATNLAVLQIIEARLGDYGPAALAVGAFSLGNAGGLVIQGWLLDRFSSGRVAAPAAVVFTVALAMAAWSPFRDTASYVALLLLAGTSLPAVTGIVRAAVPRLFPAHLRLGAYSMISVTFQAGMASGPLVAAAFYGVRSEGYALLAVAVLVVTATALVVGLSGTAGRPRTAGTDLPRDRSPVRLPSKGYATILVTMLGFGASAGIVTVALPATLAGPDQVFVGLAFSALALGDLVAGLLYGSRRWPGGLHTHLMLSCFGAASAAAALAALAGSPVLAVVMMFLVGAAGTPAAIVTSALLDQVVHPSRLTVAFTAMVATNLVALSLGSSVGGTVVDGIGPGWALAIAPIALVSAGSVVAMRKLSLGHR